ncbi:MAG: hypothetical protein M1476_04125 [Candidatus Thermoplasmatota archaeon]|nr:hypothetical protein [Candidatus Thermoplasmatota archaeon]
MAGNSERISLNINGADVPVSVGERTIDRIVEISERYDRVVLITGSDTVETFSEHLPDLGGIRGELTKVMLNYDDNLKNIRNYQKIIRVMIERNISADSLIVAIGGSSVCDISGFVACTFRGGIDYVPVPAVPLAQISNAISGINGINFSNFEDVMSTKYSPKEVIIDTHFTRHSDNEHFKDGVSEIIRYGLLGDHSLISMLSNTEDLKTLKESDGLVRLISRSIQTRSELAGSSDELHRKALCFGRIIGDTILHVSRNRAKYYEAIMAGMMLESFLGERSGISGKETRENMKSMMDRYSLKKSSIKEIGTDNILKSLAERFQIDLRKLSFVVPEGAGKPEKFEMERDRIVSGLRAFTEQYEYNPSSVP